MHESLDYVSQSATHEQGSITRAWLEPPGMILLGALPLAVGLTLCAATVPTGHFTLVLVSFMAWLATLVGWGTRASARLFVLLKFRMAWSEWRAHWLRWSTLPLVVLLTICLIVTDVPLRLGLLFSDAALSDVALRARSGESIKNARAGIYVIERAKVTDDGVLLYIAGAGFINSAGFAYCATTAPHSSSGFQFQKLKGPWYLFIDEF